MSDAQLFPELDRIRIVLVGTSHPGNIGGVARAMKNMGLSDLALVSPRCAPNERDAVSRASGADDVLSGLHLYNTLPDAIAACSWVVGCSARSRTLPWPMRTPREYGVQLSQELRQGDGEGRIAILFGREDTGLTNEELHHCHAHVHIPTNPDFSSLNLAAAVQLMAYESRLAVLAPETASATLTAAPEEAHWDHPLASQEDTERFFAHMEQALIALDFHDPDNPRQLMPRLRRLFSRTRLDKMEVNILRGILSAVERQSRAASVPARSRENPSK